MRNGILLTSCWTLFMMLPILQVDSMVPSGTYCAVGAPAISWPSHAIDKVQRISLADAGARLTLAPVDANRLVVQLRTPVPYHTAAMRMESRGAMVASSALVQDCGSQAVGITNSFNTLLLGVFQSELPLAQTRLPLRFDITIVLEDHDDGQGNVRIVYAYEKIFVEPWMIGAPSGTRGTTGDISVIATGNGGLDVDMRFVREGEVLEPVVQQPVVEPVVQQPVVEPVVQQPEPVAVVAPPPAAPVVWWNPGTWGASGTAQVGPVEEEELADGQEQPVDDPPLNANADSWGRGWNYVSQSYALESAAGPRRTVPAVVIATSLVAAYVTMF